MCRLLLRLKLSYMSYISGSLSLFFGGDDGKDGCCIAICVIKKMTSTLRTSRERNYFTEKRGEETS
jgi:hypothetical protein